jgi:hypothetical protein
MSRPLTTLLCAGALLTTGVACTNDEEPTASEDSPSTTAESTTESTTTATEARADGAQDVISLPFLEPIDAGKYFIDPDADPATPLVVTFDVPEGWSSWLGAVKFTDAGHTAVSVLMIENLVREGCNDLEPLDPPVGPTVDDLVTALTELEPFEVTQPPSDMTILGYEGKHLELTVPELDFTGTPGATEDADCERGLHSWMAPNLAGPFHGYNDEPGRTEEFWILDVDGTRLVLETEVGPSSPAEHVAELQEVFDSIQIEP